MKLNIKTICARASFTLEAALVLPMILFAMAKSIEYGINMHEDVKKCSVIETEYRDFSPQKLIYGLRFAGQLKINGTEGEDAD